MRFASIDIGSNAVRLLFANVFENDNEVVFKKESLIRIPVRLGMDTFSNGEISQARAENLIKTMKAFSYLMEVNEISGYKACATAAIREAANGTEVVELSPHYPIEELDQLGEAVKESNEKEEATAEELIILEASLRREV